MTMITVRYPTGAIDLAARKELATTLTDAVLEVELGQQVDAARMAFQVQFLELPPDQMVTDGELCSESGKQPIYTDIAVMDGPWGEDDREHVITRVFEALTTALNVERPSIYWWVNFRVIDEGSWGSGGSVTHVTGFVGAGFFTEAKEREIVRRFGQ